jgi:Ala-tRNA(Pro) deacylase
MEGIMGIAPTLQKYLDQTVTYDVIPHEPTMSSMRTAEVCHISGNRLAKGIVLRRDGGYMLAVLPASCHIQLPELRTQLGEDVRLATEDEMTHLFADCAPGAVPPIGTCYALDAIIDESINDQPEVYIEGGDHATLIHMDQSQFARLTTQAQQGRFSARI